MADEATIRIKVEGGAEEGGGGRGQGAHRTTEGHGGGLPSFAGVIRKVLHSILGNLGDVVLDLFGHRRRPPPPPPSAGGAAREAADLFRSLNTVLSDFRTALGDAARAAHDFAAAFREVADTARQAAQQGRQPPPGAGGAGGAPPPPPSPGGGTPEPSPGGALVPRPPRGGPLASRGGLPAVPPARPYVLAAAYAHALPAEADSSAAPPSTRTNWGGVFAGLTLLGAGLLKATEAVVRFATVMADPSDDPSRPIAAFGSEMNKVGGFAVAAGAGLALLNPVVGGAVAAVGALGMATGGLTSAFAELMQAVDGMVDRYGAYSPEIAQAQALAEVTQVLGDLRRSREVESNLASYVQARTELQQRFEDQKIKFMNQVLPLLITALDLISKITDIISIVQMAVPDKVKEATSVMSVLLQGILRNTKKEESQDEDWMTAVILGQRTPQFPFQTGPTGPAGGP